MRELRLHFSKQVQPDHALVPGVHRLVRQASGIVGLGDAVQGALLAQFCVDQRGLWLQVANGARGIHVNGRPVRRMALLRAGDAVYADGVELVVQAPRAATTRLPEGEDHAHDPRVVLRGVGGPHHGRSHTLGPRRLVGAAREADIRIDDPSFAQRHALLERHGDRVLLRDLGSAEGTLVNGVAVRDAILQAGDQLVFDGQHRFVLEFPDVPAAGETGRDRVAADAQPPVARQADGVRLHWLLAAAVLLAASFSALLWFGAR